MTYGGGNLTNGGGVCVPGTRQLLAVDVTGKPWPQDPIWLALQREATMRELKTIAPIAGNALRELHEKCDELAAAKQRIAELEQLIARAQFMQLSVATVDDYLLWLAAVRGVKLGEFDLVKRSAEEVRSFIYELAARHG